MIFGLRSGLGKSRRLQNWGRSSGRSILGYFVQEG